MIWVAYMLLILAAPAAGMPASRAIKVALVGQTAETIELKQVNAEDAVIHVIEYRLGDTVVRSEPVPKEKYDETISALREVLPAKHLEEKHTLMGCGSSVLVSIDGSREFKVCQETLSLEARNGLTRWWNSLRKLLRVN